MDCYPEVVDNKQARKRRANPANWKRNKAKVERYSSKELPVKPECTHKDKKLKCSTISMIDLANFHSSFYALKEKTKQDAFILKHVIAVNTKRRRPRARKNYKPRCMQSMYRVYCKSQKKMIFVCQKAFLKILHVKRYRLENTVKNYYLEGKFPRENRGGDHKSHKYRDKKLEVISFIKKFKCTEPHYCRGSSTKRLYLISELSINKMTKMYNEQASEGLKVKPGYFRFIFNTCFNLGFGSPRVDVCSSCLQYQERLKIATASEKITLMAEITVHKRRAKAFFSMLKEESPSIKIISFDCQKNMPLPKIPDQSTYYSRQLYFFNFTVVVGSSKTALAKNNVFSYCWTEDEFAKDANLIASAVFHRLRNEQFSQECRTLRIMADGCAGQNKNTILIAMLSKWLAEYAPVHIHTIEIVFPVVGHSFLPADRVFARIEKDLKKLENIISPLEYLKVVSDHSTTTAIATECQVYDWKSEATSVFLNVGRWHVPFAKCKRFYIKRASGSTEMIGLRGELHYKQDLGEYKTICKKNKNSRMIRPRVISKGVEVKPLKLRDVNKLLIMHYGNEWRKLATLQYFIQVLPLGPTEAINDDENEHENENEHNELCEIQEELPALII